jgi:hypothetical protein
MAEVNGNLSTTFAKSGSSEMEKNAHWQRIHRKMAPVRHLYEMPSSLRNQVGSSMSTTTAYSGSLTSDWGSTHSNSG